VRPVYERAEEKGRPTFGEGCWEGGGTESRPGTATDRRRSGKTTRGEEERKRRRLERESTKDRQGRGEGLGRRRESERGREGSESELRRKDGSA